MTRFRTYFVYLCLLVFMAAPLQAQDPSGMSVYRDFITAGNVNRLTLLAELDIYPDDAPGFVSGYAFSANGQFLVVTTTSETGEPSQLIWWDSLNGLDKGRVELSDGGWHDWLLFSPDEMSIIAPIITVTGLKTNYSLGVWDIETGESVIIEVVVPLDDYEVCGDFENLPVMGGVFDGEALLVYSRCDGQMITWEPETGAVEETTPATGIALGSPPGIPLATDGWRFYDLRSGDSIGALDRFVPETALEFDVAFDTGLSQFAYPAPDRAGILFAGLSEEAPSYRLTSESGGRLGQYVFSLDGTVLASQRVHEAFQPDEIDLWDVANGLLVATIKADWNSEIAFTPDGTALLTVKDDVVRVWGVSG
jgi:WD40 repeat protein